eukprot:490997_1
MTCLPPQSPIQASFTQSFSRNIRNLSSNRCSTYARSPMMSKRSPDFLRHPAHQRTSTPLSLPANRQANNAPVKRNVSNSQQRMSIVRKGRFEILEVLTDPDRTNRQHRRSHSVVTPTPASSRRNSDISPPSSTGRPETSEFNVHSPGGRNNQSPRHLSNTGKACPRRFGRFIVDDSFSEHNSPVLTSRTDGPALPHVYVTTPANSRRPSVLEPSGARGVNSHTRVSTVTRAAACNGGRFRRPTAVSSRNRSSPGEISDQKSGSGSSDGFENSDPDSWNDDEHELFRVERSMGLPVTMGVELEEKSPIHSPTAQSYRCGRFEVDIEEPATTPKACRPPPVRPSPVAVTRITKPRTNRPPTPLVTDEGALHDIRVCACTECVTVREIGCVCHTSVLGPCMLCLSFQVNITSPVEKRCGRFSVSEC